MQYEIPHGSHRSLGGFDVRLARCESAGPVFIHVKCRSWCGTVRRGSIAPSNVRCPQLRGSAAFGRSETDAFADSRRYGVVTALAMPPKVPYEKERAVDARRAQRLKMSVPNGTSPG